MVPPPSPRGRSSSLTGPGPAPHAQAALGGGEGWAGSGCVALRCLALPSGSGAGERQVVSSEHGCGRQGAGVRRERGPGVPVRAVLQVQELGARRAGAGRSGTGCGEAAAAGQRGAVCPRVGANGSLTAQWVASIDLAENEEASASVVVRATESFTEQAEQVGARGDGAVVAGCSGVPFPRGSGSL